MPEIGNFYEPYRRAQREKIVALEMLARAKEIEQQREDMVAMGLLRKIVSYKPNEHLTTIHYKPVNTD